MPRKETKTNPQTKRQRDEDQQDLRLIRKELAKGGKTYTHAQVMREMGYDDLANPVHKRS